MTVEQLIADLQKLPKYADVNVEIGEEFRDFKLKMGDDYPAHNVALVKIIPE